jgi:hypothetical protein
LAFDPETLQAMLHVCAIIAGEIAFRKTEIVNSVEEVCFTDAICSRNGHDHFIERKTLMSIIFELCNTDRPQEHGLQDKKDVAIVGQLSMPFKTLLNKEQNVQVSDTTPPPRLHNSPQPKKSVLLNQQFVKEDHIL